MALQCAWRTQFVSRTARIKPASLLAVTNTRLDRVRTMAAASTKQVRIARHVTCHLLWLLTLLCLFGVFGVLSPATCHLLPATTMLPELHICHLHHQPPATCHLPPSRGWVLNTARNAAGRQCSWWSFGLLLHKPDDRLLQVRGSKLPPCFPSQHT